MTSDDAGAAGQPRAEEAANRLRDIASETLQQATEAAKDVSAKVDAGGLGFSDLVKTAVRLAGITLAGGLELAESALSDRPRPSDINLLALGDNLAAVGQRAVAGMRGVVADNRATLEGKPPDFKEWTAAAMKLTDVAVVGAIEAVETAVAGPAPYGPPKFVSDPFRLEGTEAGTLCVVDGFKRPGTTEPIPAERISFAPKALDARQREFRVVVDEVSLPSGIYVGTVGLGSNDSGAASSNATPPLVVALRL
ncbi:MAG TPA: hypothetical protein VFW21_14700 [Mycobacterium sp.]|nr:hypothetical protein [Mycobacterium sp.]